MPLAPPAMSPRMMSLACSTMSEVFSTALVAMSLAASTTSLAVMAIGVSFGCRTFWFAGLGYDSRRGARRTARSVVDQAAPVVFRNLGAGPQYSRQPNGHRHAEQPQP